MNIKRHWRKAVSVLLFLGVGLLAGMQLGSEPPPPPPTPTPTPTGTLVASAIDMGGDHNCAISTDAHVYCWGNNDHKELGMTTTETCGTAACSTAPRLVSGVSNVAQVSAGFWHTCVVTTSNAAKCWGDNSFGQLGDLGFCGTTCIGPVTPSGLGSGVKEISAGLFHTCAIMTSNEVKCWGDNYNGVLGTGSPPSDSDTPVTAMAASGTTRSSLVTGAGHTCVLSGGEVWCWGDNTQGQLGVGYSCPIICEKYSPTLIPAGFDNLVYFLWGGSSHTCAMDGINRVIKCWGQNSDGQLGLNDTSNRNVPTQLFGDGSGVHSMAGGEGHTCTEKNSGLQCWGKNSSGQVGDGTTTGRLTPTAISGFSTVSTVGAGANHSCLLTTGGNVWCWGDNDLGQLGSGSASDYNATPSLIVPVP